MCLLGAAIIQFPTTSPAKARPAAAARRVEEIPLPDRAPRIRPQSAQVETETPEPARNSTNPAPSSADETPRSMAGPAASGVPLPPRPTNPLAERVHTVLEKHCARCHQSGALQGRLSSDGGIANILTLDAIARNSALVRPGEPDNSPLYQQMIARQMPSDILRGGAPGDAPDAIEIRAVRDWIKALNGLLTDGCTRHAPLTRHSLLTTVSQWLAAIGPERAADTRFISLAHIYDTCADDAELAAYRQGVVSVLNSLSWSPKPATIETVGDTLAILAVRLSDLGWTREHWEELIGQLAPAARLDMPVAITQLAGTAVPLVAGDWLAHEVSRPELYSRLLGLPSTLDDLARILGIELGDGREDRTVRRGIALDSKVTGGPRIIERYATPRGPLWMTHDYSAATDASILDFPLLPWASAGGNDPSHKLPKPLRSRALFLLPNGSPAFMLFDDEGNASLSQPLPIAPAADEGPGEEPGRQGDANPGAEPPEPPAHAEKATDSGAAGNTANPPTPTRHMSNGLSCFECHATGPLAFEDHLAEHLASDSYRGNTVERDIARRIVVSKPGLESALADDRYAVRRAMGVDAMSQIDGHDVITGLAARYVRELDLATAAAELLVPTAQLRTALSNLSRSATPVAALATRLILGRLTRAEFERLRPALPANQITSPELEAPSNSPPASSSLDTAALPLPSPAPGTLLLWPDKVSYNRDDRIVLSVSAGQPCHLTLINIDKAGRATVLFPNEFSRDNLLKANEVKRLPAADALYFFGLQQSGTESFVAICEVGEPVPAGIRPDFMRMNFTELGDWEAFLDASVNAAREPRVPLDNGDDLDRRRARKKAPRPAPATSPAQFRAAVTVTIAP
ncbi:MAG: DUF4384 domain-containing protein [Hyphomicrobiaceae bacterium]